MGGGTIQLVASGGQDIYLIGIQLILIKLKKISLFLHMFLENIQISQSNVLILNIQDH